MVLHPAPCLMQGSRKRGWRGPGTLSMSQCQCELFPDEGTHTAPELLILSQD